MQDLGSQATHKEIFSSSGQTDEMRILDRLGAMELSWVREQMISQILQPVQREGKVFMIFVYSHNFLRGANRKKWKGPIN